jgi:hypothetical protein
MPKESQVSLRVPFACTRTVQVQEYPPLLSKDSQHAATNRKQLASTSTRMGTRKFVSRGVVRTITTNTDRTTDSLEGERGEIRCKLLPSAFPYCRASPALAISPCMPR